MRWVRRRGLAVAGTFAAGAALAAGTLTGPSALAATAAPAVPSTAVTTATAQGADSVTAVAVPGAAAGDPTITIRVGGVRTAENGPPGPSSVTGLAGATFKVTPASPGLADTCVSNAAGLCVLNVAAKRTYTVTQAGTPAGWFSLPTLVAGSPAGIAPHPYSSLSVPVGTGNVTVPVPAGNNDLSPTARGGTWAVARAEPEFPTGCGLRIALLIDLSSSISDRVLPTYKAAARSIVEALRGTPSSFAIYTFGTTAPVPGGNNATLGPVSTATQAGVDTLVRKINGLTVPRNSGTNWDAGFWQIARDNAASKYQSVITLTDGNPTYYGPPSDLGGRGSATRFAETENAVFSANALKAQGTSVISVGIGTTNRGVGHPDNLRAVSGPVANKDYYNTDFEQLSRVLQDVALQNCAGLRVTKAASPDTYDHVGQKVTYHYTVTNSRFFTLHDVRVTDDRITGPVSCVPATLTTGQAAACSAGYTVTQADLDAGKVTNTARGTGITPNQDSVTSPPADATVRARPGPAIGLEKTASPAEYTAPGERVGYQYRVTNPGNVTLHGITLTDDKVGAVACPSTTLAPGDSLLCTAAHVTTQADVNAGSIANAAIVTGHPPTGPPVTAADTAIVRAVGQPGITVTKSASPARFAHPGERIAYSYLVMNTGNVTLHGITLSDDKLGAVACPAGTLSPHDSMTCSAGHVTTQADVDAGSIANVATVTGHPPTGPPVTHEGRTTVPAVQQPGITVKKSASPAEITRQGERIAYSYLVTNTGNVTLHGITLADDRLGRVACPSAGLAPGRSMTCSAAHLATLGELDSGQIVNEATVAGLPPTGPPVRATDTAVVRAIRRPGVSVSKTAAPAEYSAAGQRIGYDYRVTNTGNVLLHGITLSDDRLGAVACPLGTLSPGVSMTCTAGHLTTQADLDAGSIVNTATVTGHPPTGPPVRSEGRTTVPAAQRPAITLDKSATPRAFARVGERISYSYRVTNTGNVTLHGITLSDNRLGRVTCPSTTINAGGSVTCTATHLTRQHELDAGRIVNDATATGIPPTGASVRDGDTDIVLATHQPGISVAKSASPASFAHPGERISYSYLVTNTGNVTLHGITLADDRLGPVSCPSTALTVGRSMTCTAAHVTTQANVNAGDIVNTATVTGRPPIGPPVTSTGGTTVPAVQRPNIALDKTASPAQFTRLGQRITYRYEVTNRGNVTLRAIALLDDRLGTVACPSSALAPGQSMRCDAVHLTTQGELDKGRIINEATVAGSPPTGRPVGDSDTEVVRAIQVPGITVAKSASPATFTHAGRRISYSYRVVNSGNVTLHGITLGDDRLGAVSCPATLLGPGAAMTCAAEHAATQAELNAGGIANTATVTGVPPTGVPVRGTGRTTVSARQRPGVTVRKSALPVDYSRPGQAIGYGYLVTNTGNVTLHGITLEDNQLGAVNCPLDTLDPGDSMPCTAAHLITQADIDGGSITNAATVTGHPPAGPPVRSTDRFTVHALQAPAITLDKTASPAEYAAPGDRISYGYLVTNSGNVTLHRIALADNRLGTVSCPSGILAPAASMTCTAGYATTQADVDAGQIVNEGTVTGLPPTGEPVAGHHTAIVQAVQQPDITLDKSATPAQYAGPGDRISYSYLVINSGNVTLHRISLADDRLGGVTCPSDTLAPVASMTCTAGYTTNQADVDAGQIVNEGTVTGLPPAGEPVTSRDTEVVDAVHRADITVVKTASVRQYSAPGQRITYSYLVSNSGNVTLHGITLADDRLGPVTCPAGSLSPGASMTCTAAHVTTQADVAAGSITNTATVTGYPPTGTPVTTTGRTTVPAVHHPGITLRKTPFPLTYGAPGQSVTYTYRVTNTGNVALHGIALTDDQLGTVTCPADGLAAGRSMTCHAVKVITTADVAKGHITNHAVVTGRPPGGHPVTGTDTATVTTAGRPAIAVSKTAAPLTYSAPGTAIAYTYVVVNTGTVVLHDVTAVDNRLGAVTCASRTLRPGQSTTCHGSYVTGIQDVKAGHVANTVTATGLPPHGPGVTAKATANVKVVRQPVIPVTS